MRVLSAIVLLACAAPAAWATERGPAKAGVAGHQATPSRRGARLLGTAFRTKAGAGEIVIQTSGEVELETHDQGTAPVFVLKHCRILRPNDRRPLDTRFFDSPVTGVTVKERGPDLQFFVALRAPSTATPREEHGPGNTWYWILSFPPGATAEKAARADRATAAANP